MDGSSIQKFPEAPISAHTSGSCHLQTSFAISVLLYFPQQKQHCLGAAPFVHLQAKLSVASMSEKILHNCHRLALFYHPHGPGFLSYLCPCLSNTSQTLIAQNASCGAYEHLLQSLQSGRSWKKPHFREALKLYACFAFHNVYWTCVTPIKGFLDCSLLCNF